MAARDEVDEPTVELPEYDPQQRPLLDGLNGYTRFRWQKPSRPAWTSMAARIIGGITIVLLTVILWRVIRHNNHRPGRKPSDNLSPTYRNHLNHAQTEVMQS